MTNGETMKCASRAAAIVAALALVWAPLASAQVGVPGCQPPGPTSSCLYPNATAPTNCGAANQPACCCVCPLGGQSGSCDVAVPYEPLPFAGQPMFQYELPQPIFYVPDTMTYPDFDYYVIESARATTSFASSPSQPFLSPAVETADAYEPPPGTVKKVWLGLCAAPVDATGQCPAGSELRTEVWGYGQVPTGNSTYPAGLVTYPSMSFKATKGRPVKVKWVNNLPNTHLFCKQPLDSNVPCAIDRTIMGTLTRENEEVTEYGSPMQADNAMVVHLHGGEIPPDSDGFAELWFGNEVTADAYKNAFPTEEMNGYVQDIDPLFIAPPGNRILSPPTTGPACNLLATTPVTCPAATPVCVGNVDPATDGYCVSWNGNGTPTGDPDVAANALGSLIRPTGNSMIYNYPMVQPAATIWYHDHALGKTRINVAAGPAGYFYITDPAFEATLGLPSFGDCTNGGILAGKCFDVPIVLQDRSFNTDGSINFPNGLGQSNVFGIPGWVPAAPGANPTVHPQTSPEYFGDFAVVNGVIWPKVTVEPRPYRFRLLNGSNARCYTLALANLNPKLLAPKMTAIASDQGYLRRPAAPPTISICPGERFDVVVDFSAFPNGSFLLTNTAGAPFPNGVTPQAARSPYAGLAQLVRFNVGATCTGGCPPTWKPGNQYNPGNWTPPSLVADSTRCPWNGITTALTCQKVLNEVLDPTTAAPLRVQIDGKAFEDPVTETPKRGTTEVWQFINTTVDAHPMHLHLVQFKVLQRQAFNVRGFSRALGLPQLAFDRQPLNAVDVTGYLMGAPIPPGPEELGFKDTVKAFPGEVTTVIARWDGGWAEAPGAGPFYQPVTAGPYVWHCHIVDHEDNEMMRPSLVMP